MMTRHVFLACLATIGIVAHVSATATTPGLRFAVTNPGLTEVKDIALPIINAALKDLTIPDMNLDEHLPIIGHITLDLSDIQVTDFNLPDAALGVSSPPSVALDMSGLTLQVALNYHWRKVHWPHLSSSGSITANPSGGSIVLDMSMSTENGHVVLKSTDCSVDFSGFDVHFHGDLSWLYNFFVWLFKNTIKDSVQSAVQKELLDVVDTSLNAALAKIPTVTSLGGGKSRITVETGVIDLAAGSDYLSLGDEMAISDNATGVACPLVPTTLPDLTPGAQGSMLQLLLDDSFINCVTWSATSNGALDITVTDATLPKSFPLRLNTSAWAGLVPALEAKYPDRPMQVQLSPISAPSVKTATTGMAGAMLYDLKFSVQPSTGGLVPVFEFNSSIVLGLDVEAKMLNTTPVIVLNITELDLTMNVVSSTLGPINLAPIQSLFKSFAPLIKDLINAFMKNGFPLPGVDGLSLVGPSVEFDTGFFAIASNFSFTPTPVSDESASTEASGRTPSAPVVGFLPKLRGIPYIDV